MALAASVPFRDVAHFSRWFRIDSRGVFCLGLGHNLGSSGFSPALVEVRGLSSLDQLKALRAIYDLKIGEIGSCWNGSCQPIDFHYAKIPLGDVFDFYTGADGVLRLPRWSSFKFVVDQYMEEDPRFKFHPSKVREFIKENGIEQLEAME